MKLPYPDKHCSHWPGTDADVSAQLMQNCCQPQRGSVSKYCCCVNVQHRPPTQALPSKQSFVSEHASPAMAIPSADAREARHDTTTTAAASTTTCLILSEHVWQRPYGAGFGLSRTLIWSGQRTTGARIVPRTLTRSRGEVRRPTPGELRTVLWAILRKVEAGKIQKKSDRLGRSKLTAHSCVCPWSPNTEPP